MSSFPQFKLGPPPDPQDPRRLEWDALLWKYLVALNNAISQNISPNSTATVLFESNEDEPMMIPIPGKKGDIGAAGPSFYLLEDSDRGEDMTPLGASGVSSTITTASLGTSQGKMVFSNGILISSTPAT